MVQQLKGDYILLPLALSDTALEDRAIRFAFWLARKFNKPIRAIHVSSNFEFLPEVVGLETAPIYSVANELADVETEITELLQIYRDEKANRGVGTSVFTYTGDASKWICAESGSALMTVVSSRPPKIGLLRRFTTAHQVLTHARSPVAVIPSDSSFHDDGKNNLLFFADDLENHSANAAAFTGHLAGRILSPELCHVHVTTITKDILERGILIASGKSVEDRSTHSIVETLHAKMMDELKLKMAKRFDKFSKEFELSGLKYRPELHEGMIDMGVGEARNRFKPDIEIYGQHKTYHTFGFGKLPFESMLSAKCPVIIVPE